MPDELPDEPHSTPTQGLIERHSRATRRGLRTANTILWIAVAYNSFAVLWNVWFGNWVATELGVLCVFICSTGLWVNRRTIEFNALSSYHSAQLAEQVWTAADKVLLQLFEQATGRTTDVGNVGGTNGGGIATSSALPIEGGAATDGTPPRPIDTTPRCDDSPST